jgi:hypothetical protein
VLPLEKYWQLLGAPEVTIAGAYFLVLTDISALMP